MRYLNAEHRRAWAEQCVVGCEVIAELYELAQAAAPRNEAGDLTVPAALVCRELERELARRCARRLADFAADMIREETRAAEAAEDPL